MELLCCLNDVFFTFMLVNCSVGGHGGSRNHNVKVGAWGRGRVQASYFCVEAEKSVVERKRERARAIIDFYYINIFSKCIF